MDYDSIIQGLDQPDTFDQAMAKTQPPQDDYTTAIQEMDSQQHQAASVNAYVGAQANPDQAGRANELAKRLNVPAPVVEQNLPAFEQTVKAAQNNAALKQNPVLSQWVASNPQNARIAHDDFDKLGFLEKTITAAKDGWSQSGASDQLQRLNYQELFSGPNAQLTQQESQLKQQLSTPDGVDGTFYNMVKNFAGFIGGFGTMAKNAAPYAAAGGTVGSALPGVGTALGTGAGFLAGLGKEAFITTSGQLYDTLKHQTDKNGNPLDPNAIRGWSLLGGLASSIINSWGGGEAAAPIAETAQSLIPSIAAKVAARPTASRAMVNMVTTLGKSGLTGAAFGALGEASNVLAENLAKATDSGDWNTIFNNEAEREQAVNRIVDSAEQMAVNFSLLHLPPTGMSFATDMLRARDATNQQAFINNLASGAADSRTRERSPSAFQEFMQAQTDGSPVENLYAPAQKVMELYQSHGIDPTDRTSDPLFGFVPDMDKQLSEGVATGGDVVIPTADYATHLAGTPLHDMLKDDLRVSQDGMSVNDAKTFMQSYQDALQKGAESLQSEEPTSMDKVYQDVLNQATEAGYAPGIARQYAALYAARYGTRGERMGMDPFEAYQQSGVKIQDQGLAPEGQTLNQSGVSPEDFRAALESKYAGSKIDLFNRGDELTLSRLVVPEDQRQGGIGTKIMQEITDYADRNGKRVTLTPAGDFGGSVSRLRQFYKRFGFVENKGRNKDFEISDGMYRLPKSKTLGQEARGSITFDDGKSIINLFKSRDLSTLLHETGHLWLEELKADAANPDAPEQVKNDLSTVLKWFGVESPDQIETQHHEQFARAAEAYFMEGKAPSAGLAGVFQRFKGWLKSIYQTVANLKTPINDNIRGVFDRMVASDAEIDNARRAQKMDQLFQTPEQAGMTKAEFNAYQTAIQRAREDAREELLNKAMEKVRRERTSEYKAERKRVADQVAQEVDARPDMQALHFLRTGRMLDGSEAEAMKLSRDDLTIMYPGHQILLDMPKNTFSKDGVHPDLVAERFGFRSGDQLVKALLELEEQQRIARLDDGENRGIRQLLIDQETDGRMEQTHGDFLSDGSIQEEAMKAVHNAEQAKALAIELKALGRKAGLQGLPVEVTRAWAQKTIAEKKVRDATAVNTYARAEAKAAREGEKALLKGNYEEAYLYKRQQVLNHALYMEAKKASEEVDKGTRLLDRYASEKTIKGLDQDYLEQIQGLLERFNFKEASGPEVERRKSLAAWAQSQIDDGKEVVIPDKLLNDAFSTHYTDMSLDEFRGLRDAVVNIAHLGRLKAKLLDLKEERDFNAVVDEAVAAAEQLKQRPAPTPRNPGVGGKGLDRVNAKYLNVKTALRSFDAALLKMEQVFDWLDGGDPNGVFNRIVFRRIADAGVRENELKTQIADRMRKLQESLPKDAQKDFLNRYEIPELPDSKLPDSKTGQPSSMLKSEIIAMALNTGNASNFDKLLKGEGWQEWAVKAVLDRHMTKADWDFVQGIWDTVESLWPEIEAMEKRLSGVAPEKVEARTVVTPHGAYKGGYYPVVYDPLRAFDVEQNRQRSADKLFENNYVRATTDKGHTKERVENYARPLYLSLDVLPRHLTSVIHDLAYREAVMDADKFLADKRVREAVENSLGREIYTQFRPWLQAIANDKNYDQRGLAWWDKAAHWARTNATIVGLGFRATTMMIHGMTAASNSIGEVGPRWMLSGVNAFFGSPAKMAAARDFVYARSGEMKNRMNEIDRDVRDALRDLQGEHGPLTAVKQYAYYGISMLDMASALPTWIGAYNKSLHEGLSEDDAIYAADKAVRNAHGGGGTKDLAAVQRGQEWFKLFTMFYSFWNHFYNRQRDIGRRAVEAYDTAKEGDYGQAAKDFSMVLARSFFYFVIPQLIHAAIKPAPKGQDEDESWLGWAAKEIGLGLFSGVPVVRDIANSAFSGRDYTATPAAQIVTGIGKSGADLKHLMRDEPVSDKWVKHATQTAGYVFGLPTGQASNATQFLWDVMHAEQNPQDISDWMRGIIYGTTH